MSEVTRHRALWAGFAFSSGVAALIYEVLWLRLLSGWLGSAVLATQLVLAVFFGGMALGAAWASRWRSHHLRRYVQLEAAMALFGLLSPWLLDALGQLYITAGAGSFGARSLVALVFLLLPTLCMGATLPLLVQLTKAPDEAAAHTSSRTYLWNTLGAACGALLAGMLLPRWLGVQGGIWCAAAINALVAWLAMTQGKEATTQTPDDAAAHTTFTRIDPLWLLLFTASGFCAIAYEVLWARALLSVLGNSMYSFSAILSVYLLGLALGGGLWRAWGQRSSFGFLQALLGCLGLGTLWVLERLSDLSAWLQTQWQPGPASGLLIEWLLVFALFFAPTLIIGMLFPAMVACIQAPAMEQDEAASQTSEPQGQQVGQQVGYIVFATTLGSVLAPLIVGLWWMPKVGVKAALIHAAMLNLSIAILAYWRAPTASRSPLVAMFIGGIMLLMVPQASVSVMVASGERVLVYKEARAASIVVVVDAKGRRRLKLNGRFSMGGASGLFSERRQGHLPRLLLPHARQVLALGVGTGNTLAAVAAHPSHRIDAVELISGVRSLMPKFAATNNEVYKRREVHIHTDDARHFLATTRQRYDLIIADLFHSYKAGVGGLYTSAHYQRGRKRLRKGGCYWQWLPLHQLTPQALQVILRTFLDVFPETHGFLAYLNANTPALGLLGGQRGFRLSPKAVAQAMKAAAPKRQKQWQRVDLGTPLSVWSMYVGTPSQLKVFAKGAPHNTENRPIIELDMPLARWSKGWETTGPRSLSTLLAWPLPTRLGEAFPPASRRRLVRRMRSVRAYLGSRVALRIQSRKQAQALLLRAAALDPGWSLPQKMLSNQAAALIARREYKAAAQLLQQVVAAMPRYAEAWTQLGILAYRQGDKALAVMRFVQAVQRNPQDRVAKFNLVLLLRQQKLYAEAAGWLFKSHVHKNPGLVPACCQKHAATCAHKGPSDAGLRKQLYAVAVGLEQQRRWTWLRKAATAMTHWKPVPKQAPRWLAKALMGLKQYDKAAAVLALAIRREPKAPRIRGMLAAALLALDQLERAELVLASAVRLGLPKPIVARLQADFEKRRAAKSQRYLEEIRAKLAQQKERGVLKKGKAARPTTRASSRAVTRPASRPTSRHAK